MKKDKRGTPFYNVLDKEGNTICRVGNYSDPVVSETDGVQRLLDYIPVFMKDLEKGSWGGFVLDSVTSLADSAFLYHEHTLNPDTRNTIQWYGGESKMTSDVVTKSLPGFPCHVGVTFHVHRHKTDMDGDKIKSVRQPYVPGKRMEETKRVASAWPELYRLFTRPNEKDPAKTDRVLQTDSEGRYQCGTCLDVPNGLRVPKKLPQDFLWQGKTRPAEMHFGVFGDPHVGKSCLVAQVMAQLCAPLPFYVALFDARGKDIAYRNLGTVKEEE